MVTKQTVKDKKARTRTVTAGKTIEQVINETFMTPNIDIDDINRWHKTWNDEILIVGNVYKINNEFCVYAGDFRSTDEVPRLFCCYTIGDMMRVRHIKLDPLAEIPLKERRRRIDDDRPIDTTVKDSDNSLMILIKVALQKNNITRGDFRVLYPNTSDMNNILRCIEKGDSLSWARFTDLLEKLKGTYRIITYDENHNEISKLER
jgi:hypothetical protein